MKEGIHPTFYTDAVVVCGSCGTTWQTGSTKKEVHVDVCSNCHPFFTGTQRIVDTAGQVERFTKRLQARESMAPQGDARSSKRERRALERAKRSGMLEATQPEPVAEASAAAPAAEAATEAPAAESAVEPVTASAPRSAAPRERKPRPPRPPRERKPREDKPAQASTAEPAAVTAAADAATEPEAQLEQAPEANAANEPAPGTDSSAMVSEGAPVSTEETPAESNGDSNAT